MLPKSSGTSYSGKPVRRLKLPKIGPAKTKSLFEEYFYTLLGVVFVSVAILGKAGGFNTYNTLIVAAWITGFIWFVRQWRARLLSRPEFERQALRHRTVNRRRLRTRRKSASSCMSAQRFPTASPSCRTTGETPKTRNRNNETTD